jgi:hypothetical protein
MLCHTKTTIKQSPPQQIRTRKFPVRLAASRTVARFRTAAVLYKGDYSGGVLLVFAKLDFAAIFPTENDALVINDDQLAGDEAWMDEFLFGDLAFALECAQTGSPGGGAGRDVVVPCNLNRFQFVTALINSNDLVKMARIVSDPFSRQMNPLF